MKIICGTDFSRYAMEAADVAAALAARLNERLALVHVFDSARYGLLSKKQLEELLDRSQAELKQEAARLRKTGVTVEEELLEGSIATVLADFAAKSQARLVVVSSLGQIAPSRWLVGSVAERLAQMSPVPTLIVRGSEAFKSWGRARGGRALKILVGYDFSASSDVALRWVSELRKIGACKVTVASVSWPPQERNRLGIGGPSWLPDNPPQVQKALERDLRTQVERVLNDSTAEIRVAGTWGRPEPQLIEMAQAAQADLVVVGTHQRHGAERFWLGSVSRGILHHAPMSVACVPPFAAAESRPGSIPVFQRVLVPTDFSAVGNRAIPFAYSTLYRGGAVCLFHVLEQTASQTKVRNAGHVMQKREDQLRALVPSEAEARWIVTKIEVAQSHEPAKAICQAAERFGADLICIGSHGRSGLSKALLGSVAQAVMVSSHQPVLMVRSPLP
jgi:nucleotide-binding universal stress UspA family protein